MPKDFARTFIGHKHWDKVCNGTLQAHLTQEEGATLSHRAQSYAIRTAVAHSYYMDHSIDGWLKFGIVIVLFLSSALLLKSQSTVIQLGVWSSDIALALLYASTAMEQAMTMRAWFFALYSVRVSEYPVKISGANDMHEGSTNHELGKVHLVAKLPDGLLLPMPKFLHEKSGCIALQWHHSRYAVNAARCLLDLASCGVRFFAEKEPLSIATECLEQVPNW